MFHLLFTFVHTGFVLSVYSGQGWNGPVGKGQINFICCSWMARSVYFMFFWVTPSQTRQQRWSLGCEFTQPRDNLHDHPCISWQGIEFSYRCFCSIDSATSTITATCQTTCACAKTSSTQANRQESILKVIKAANLYNSSHSFWLKSSLTWVDCLYRVTTKGLTP